MNAERSFFWRSRSRALRHAQQTEKATFARAASGAPRRRSRRCPASISAVSGYTGGKVKNPSYEQVSSGRTGHTEAVR